MNKRLFILAFFYVQRRLRHPEHDGDIVRSRNNTQIHGLVDILTTVDELQGACYLAAGRPVITQDTGFSRILPTGAGLFAFNTMEEILAALDAVRSDYARHSRAAREIAEEYFSADVVLGELLEELG